MQIRIGDGTICDVYTPTTDNILKDLKTYRDFVFRNFKDHPKYEKMLPISNQPARLYGTAKTHKFASSDIITTEKLKLLPTITQTGNYMEKSEVLWLRYEQRIVVQRVPLRK